jgi:hypothetical protein
MPAPWSELSVAVGFRVRAELAKELAELTDGAERL